MAKPKANLEEITNYLYKIGKVNKDVITFRKVDFEVFKVKSGIESVSYTHLRAHETG